MAGCYRSHLQDGQAVPDVGEAQLQLMPIALVLSIELLAGVALEALLMEHPLFLLLILLILLIMMRLAPPAAVTQTYSMMIKIAIMIVIVIG
jgi:hypothetical protein